LRPGTLVQHVNAVLLTGGSAFGLAAADGVMRFLEEQGVGFEAMAARVPIVPAAVLFDLGLGDPAARPGPDQGYQACGSASHEVAEGNVGAGTGATVAKLHGIERAVKGGLGTASVADGDVIVGAVAAVNAVGEVINDDGSVLAGARPEEPGELAERGLGGDWPAEPPPPDSGAEPLPGMNTTLVVVATNARLSKERAHLIALAGHDGIAGAIRPAHTMWDGDTVFALATGDVEADQRGLESLAEEAVKEAIRRAVVLAHSVSDFPSAKEGRLA
jgi:L-aminopeptidase/D-esterase-like protein